jgi:hypothetical protein
MSKADGVPTRRAWRTVEQQTADLTAATLLRQAADVWHRRVELSPDAQSSFVGRVTGGTITRMLRKAADRIAAGDLPEVPR